jgi:hypothetical protein
MKRLMVLAVLGMLFSAANGCRVCDCWREAWNPRPRPQPQQTVVVGEPCVVSDPCSSPCANPCTAAPMMVPGPVPSR